MAKKLANATDSYLYSPHFPNKPATPAYPAMIVCVCHRISDREIARHARAGMSFDEIQFELGVATQCGCCEASARDVVAQCCGSQPVAALRNDTAPQHSQLAHLLQEGNACCKSSSPSLAV